MKISTRLSLFFSVIASGIFMMAGFAIYWLASTHRAEAFKERLLSRLEITEKIFLEKEQFTEKEIEKIKTHFSNSLPHEKEEVVALIKNEAPLSGNYPQAVFQQMVSNSNFYFEYNNRQGLSKKLKFPDRTYLLVVSATDTTGLRNLAYLKSRMVAMLLIAIPLILLSSFLIVRAALQPLTQKIQHANAIGADNLYQRLKVYNPEDEIGKLATAFNKLLDRIEASFEAQKSFISNASHEIRNPLTAIIGEAEIALSKPRNQQEYIEALQHMLAEAENLNTTVSNLLQLSKISANETALRFSKINFNNFVNETMTSFGFSNPDSQLHLYTAPKLQAKKAEIKANPALLKSVLFNLWDNACKFSANSPVEVSLTGTNGQVTLRITDKGIGIAPHDLEKIRNPFYRGKNALQVRGSGIGLALTEKILMLHQSSLQIQSELGKGTMVSFTLTCV